MEKKGCHQQLAEGISTSDIKSFMEHSSGGTNMITHYYIFFIFCGNISQYPSYQ